MKIRHCAALLIALLTVSLLAGCYATAAEHKPEKAVEPRQSIREESVEETISAAVPAAAQPEEEIPAVTEHDPLPENAVPVIPETAPPETVPMANPDSAQKLTTEQAKAIALDHAGFGAEEVRFLRAEYEIDNRIPQYEIEFDVGHREYEYEIHAETGKILSFEKDD